MSVSTARGGGNATTSCLSQTVSFDILQAAVNGAAQVYTLEEKIPARAVVLQHWISLDVEFSGGGHKLSEVTAGSLSVNVIYAPEAALDRILPLV